MHYYITISSSKLDGVISWFGFANICPFDLQGNDFSQNFLLNCAFLVVNWWQWSSLIEDFFLIKDTELIPPCPMCLKLEVKIEEKKLQSHNMLEITILEANKGRWRTCTTRNYYIIFTMSYGIQVNWNVYNGQSARFYDEKRHIWILIWQIILWKNLRTLTKTKFVLVEILNCSWKLRRKDCKKIADICWFLDIIWMGYIRSACPMDHVVFKWFS